MSKSTFNIGPSIAANNSEKPPTDSGLGELDATNNPDVMYIDWESEIAAALEDPHGILNPTGFDWFAETSDPEADSLSVLEVSPWESSGRSLLPELPAETLRAALLRAGDSVDPSGISIRGVRISGPLRLDDFKISYPLHFRFVEFDSHVSMTMLQGTMVAITDSHVKNGANFSHATLSQGVDLSWSRVDGQLTFDHANLGSFSGVGIEHYSSPPGTNFSLQGVRVAGNCNLNGAKLYCEVDLVGARVGGRLDLKAAFVQCCGEATCTMEHFHDAIVLDAARIESGIFLADTVILGRFKGAHLEVGGGVEAPNLTILGVGENLLTISDSTVNGNIRLHDLRIESGINLDGTRCDNLRINDSIILAGADRAIDLMNSAVQMNFNIDRSLVVGRIVAERAAIGKLWLNGALVFGCLNLAEAGIGNVQAIGLSLHETGIFKFPFTSFLAAEAVIRHSADDASSVVSEQAAGTVAASLGVAARRVTGDQLRDLVLHPLATRPPRRKSAPSRRASTPSPTQNVLMLDRSVVAGATNLTFTHLYGNISFSDSTLDGRLSIAQTDASASQHRKKGGERLPLRGNIDFTGVVSKGGISLGGREVIRLDGAITASNAAIADEFNLNRVEFSKALVLRLDGAKFGHLSLPGMASVCLDGAQIETLQVSPIPINAITGGRRLRWILKRQRFYKRFRVPRWAPATLKRASRSFQLRGERAQLKVTPLHATRQFRIERLTGAHSEDWRLIERWLDSSASTEKGAFHAQPWLAVADVFESAGDQRAARKLRFAATHRLMKRRPGVFAKFWRWTTRWTIGYGYQPWLALIWLFALWTAAFGLGWTFDESFVPSEVMAPAGITINGSSDSVPVPQPKFYAALYAVDIVVPALDTGQAAAWRLTSEMWLVATFAVLRGFSWGLLGLFVTGVAGLFKAK